MKRVMSIIILLVLFQLLAFSCKTKKTLTISGGELYYNNTILRDLDYTFNFPLISNQKINKIELMDISGKYVKDINFSIDLSDIIQEHRGYYKYFLNLKTNNSLNLNTLNESMEIEALKLKINDKILDYRISQLKISKVKDIPRGNDIVFYGAMLISENLDLGYTTEIKSSKNIIIKDIYFTNEIEIESIMEKDLQKYINSKILMDVPINWRINVSPKKDFPKGTVLVSDFIIEYINEGEEQIRYATPAYYLVVLDGSSKTFNR